MIVLAKLAKKPWHHIWINVFFKADLLWWRTFLETWNGMSILVQVDKLGIDKVGINCCFSAVYMLYFLQE